MPGADDGRPEPPIYLAGVNPQMTRIAGECADGFAAHMFLTEAYLDEVIEPALAAGAIDAGREKPVVLLSLLVAPSREMLARQMTAYAVPGYRRVLDRSGDQLAVSLLEDVTSGIGRWGPRADRMTLCVPWYGIAIGEQVEIFRQVLSSLERM
jgi:alkanesulfonate monooxygenase SsuD/methylene tetrahydromethanopterin reductase-like flavin-dependent oxidoreductase (luciferase family)